MKIKQKVERGLSVDKKTRDNDKLLMLAVWEIEGFFLSDVQKSKFMEVSSPETIRRMRQKLQEEGKYKASEEVGEERYNRYVETRAAMPRVDSGEMPKAIPWMD